MTEGLDVGPAFVGLLKSFIEKSDIPYMKFKQRTYLVELSKSLLVLMNEAELLEKLRRLAPSENFRIYLDETATWAEAKQMKLMPSERREWYYKQGQKTFGVYNELELIRLVQSKKIHATQLVWRPGKKAWAEFCRTDEFCAQNLRRLVNEFPPLLETVFLRRKSKRISFQADFILRDHEKEKIWKAESFEIGTGGIGIQVRNGGLSIGQSFDLHLLSQGVLKNLKAKVEVVSHLKHAKGLLPDRMVLNLLKFKSRLNIR